MRQKILLKKYLLNVNILRSIMVIDFKTGKDLSVSKWIHSRNFDSFIKELKEWIYFGYKIKILNTSLKFTRFGKRESFYAELIHDNLNGKQ